MLTNTLHLENSDGSIKLIALIDIVDGEVLPNKKWIWLEFVEVDLPKGKTKHLASWDSETFVKKFLKKAHKCYKMGKNFSKLLDKNIAEEEDNSKRIKEILGENEEFLSELYLELKKLNLL
jgi:hypothetical protein